MPEEEPRLRVTDKRGGKQDAPAEPREPDEHAEPEVKIVEINRDYLDDLKRLQAEFDNYRKRIAKQQADTARSAVAGLMKRLLPVLDHFQLAVEHGEGGGGVQLAFKELMEALGSEGLQEIEAEGQPFDPQMHEAVETHEDPEVRHETVIKVHRRGYTFNGQLLRAPYVGVARPLEESG